MNTSCIAPTHRRLDSGDDLPSRSNGHSPACTQIEGVSVTSLAAEFGSPLFVFSEAALRRMYREAHSAFAQRYPDVQFAWSYKTNYLNAICQVFHQEGSIAEVVSDLEYEKARHNGVEGRNIIFNGPHKCRASLERAVAEGAMVQVDNLDELFTLSQIARDGRTVVPVALRIHVNTHSHEKRDQLGFNADNGEAMQVLRRLKIMPELRVRGFHCHVGTSILDPNVYRVATTRLVELSLAAHEMRLGLAEYLNLGGGFASGACRHLSHFLPEHGAPSFARYAEAICDTLKQLWPATEKLPRLYLETGRALIDDAGWLLSTVVAVMKPSKPGAHDQQMLRPSEREGLPVTSASHSRNAVVLDAGVNLLYAAAWYQPAITPARPSMGPLYSTTIFGCLCMNIDVIREAAPLPALDIADHVVIHPVGAYGMAQSMQCVAYRPAVVMIDETGAPHVIRRKEDLHYVQELEDVPSHLRPST